ncbi:cellulose synthase-like protein G3 isoform X2 [Canna indica]|uniref:Cellulose synthase-like protein G3 isoform X2 n=1 Tax=Canna indica TaxID=4628 RepID=A0AAQ3K6K9_9LILI|nr:cellulose synthase-like protein G3 isoform X2 [Canna indica]
MYYTIGKPQLCISLFLCVLVLLGIGKEKMTISRKAFHTLRASRLVPFNRAHMLLYFVAVLAAVYRRFDVLFSSPGPVSIVLLLADLIFAFMWLTYQALRWRPVRRQEFPDRLLQEVDPKEFPAIDVFICTADPYREPPVSVASTALSVMAFDYPADKLSIYVSDDGGSDITLFAFIEAARFARYWLPFCKENGIAIRSPEAYFRSRTGDGDSDKMKMMYQAMKEKVDIALERGYVGNDLLPSDEDEVFKKWKGISRNDHPSIIQVLLESTRDSDISGNALPNLIYVSREKRPNSPHNFKAGALNVLTRVSRTMSNAPLILTLDCDTYSNDPRSPIHALCYFLDPDMSSDLAFVQFPQIFQGLNKNDIYACEVKRLYTINPRGKDGVGGPNYVGTGCYFLRRALQGSTLSSPKTNASFSSDFTLKKAHEAASCAYEAGSKWGSSIGFRYRSLSEDFHTGFHLHCEGWKSVFCYPEKPAFLGDVPQNLNDVLGQRKRWSVGLFEVAFSRYCPLTFGTMNASLLEGLCYAHEAFWGSWSIPITIYGLLPQLALIYYTPLFPKVSDPWFYLYSYLFLAAYGQDLFEFLAADGTFGRWWSDQRMWMIIGQTSYLFGTLQFALKKIGISAQGFNVTSKVIEDEQSERYEKGAFDFGAKSPFFAVLGTVAIVNLSSLVAGIARAATVDGVFDEMFVQLFLSAFVAVNCLPIYHAMFLRSDGGKMPRKVTVISFAIAGFLLGIGYLIFHI